MDEPDCMRSAEAALLPALPRVWWDGRLVEEAEALLPATSQGWLWGRGLFETIAVRSGLPLALSRHLDRLRGGAVRLGLELPDDDSLRGAVQAVLTDCPPELHRLRITLSGGEGPGLMLSPGPGHLLIRRERVDPALSAGPAHLLTVPWRRNEFSPLCGIKSTSYAENPVALAWARDRDATEALFLNTAGDLCEGAVSNLFIVTKGIVFTPSLSSGCLPGITRSLILELCSQLRIPWQEKALDPSLLTKGDGIFLTNSLHGIQPVAFCDQRVLDAPCAVTAQLAAALQELFLRLPDP